MAGPRKSSSLPAKKPKAKAAKIATIPKSSLSSEFVVDSDDSQDAETARQEKSAPKTANSRFDLAKPAEPQPSISQGKPSKKRKLPSSSPEELDSGGSSSGNDSTSEDEQRPSKKRILAARNGSPTPKPKPATARPVLAKPSPKASFNIKPLNHNRGHGSGATSKESGSETEAGSEDDGSGSESESESGSGDGSVSGSSDKTSLKSPEKESPVRKSVPQQTVTAFEPPAGFEPRSISLHPASKVSEILAPSNLKGKQIWHITVPNSVSISLVKEVSTQNIGNGASILESHGAEYGLVRELDVEQSSSRALLLPSTQTNNYRPSKTNITKTLHLQQLVSLPSHAPQPAANPSHPASAADSYKKTPRPQPEGLRMRYHPFGASDDSDLESTPEPMSKVREFRIPAPVKESSPQKKRKRPESNDGRSDSVPTVKSKKRKQSPQATAGATDDPIDTDVISDIRSTGAESQTRTPHPETNGFRSNGNLPNGKETKEERRKRKEKKKLEKRTSPSKPATALPLDVKQNAETIQPGEVVEGTSATANANAVEGTKSILINGISSSSPPPKKETTQDAKAKHKDEKKRRRRKEMEMAMHKGASSKPVPTKEEDEEDGSLLQPDGGGQDQMMREIETAQREAEVLMQPLGRREKSPPPSSNRAKSKHVLGDREDSQLQGSVVKEEDKRKKKREEKRKRRGESRDA